MEALAGIAIGIIIVFMVLASFKRFDLSILLVLCNMVIFIVQIFWPLSNALSFSPIYLQTGDNLYTIITSMFAHSSIFHLLGNMLFLILLGPALEQRIGKAKFAAAYFISGIVATLVFSAMVWNDAVIYYLLGASGAISGIIGTFLVNYPRDKITMVLGFIVMPNVPVWAVTAAWFFFDVILAMSSPATAWQAHLGGFLAGLVIGLLIYRSVRTEHPETAPSVKSLEEIATNDRQREAIAALRDETNPDIQKAWREYFAENTPCPNCGSMMQWSKNSLKCNCGYSRKIR